MSAEQVSPAEPAVQARPPRMVKLAQRCWVPEREQDDLFVRCAAAVATSADDTVLASTTAARLHGLWLPVLPDEIRLATATPDRVGRQMTRAQRPQFVAHRFQLRECDIVLLDGLPVTSLARTWRDLAGVLGLADLVAAGDCALRSGCSRDALAEAIARTPRRAFTRLARAAFALLDERSRSRPESHLRVAVSTPDLPKFEVNMPVYRAEGGWLAEPDLSLVEARIALEYQGEDHARVPRMRKDLTRAVDMRGDRWLVHAYGPTEVFRRPEAIYLEVRRNVEARAPHLLRGRRRTRFSMHAPPRSSG